MATVAAATLSEQQVKKTLIARKKKINPGKTVLCSPFAAKWPKIEPSAQHEIISLLKQFLKEHGPPCKDRKSRCQNKTKDPQTPVEHALKPDQEKLKLRLVCGVQKVTRCLERDQLAVVVVDRSSPWQLHQHLAQLSAVRHCPAVAVDGLDALIRPLLHITRLCALGFMKADVDDWCEFDRLVESISIRCPTIELPWMECEDALRLIREAAHANTSEEKNTAAVQMESKKGSSCGVEVKSNGVKYGAKLEGEACAGNIQPVDYSHLYVFKQSKTVSDKPEMTDFIALPSSSGDDDDDDDTDSDNYRDDYEHTCDRRTPGSVKSDKEILITKPNLAKRKALEESVSPSKVYRSPNVGVQVANPNKKRKQKL